MHVSKLSSTVQGHVIKLPVKSDYTSTSAITKLYVISTQIWLRVVAIVHINIIHGYHIICVKMLSFRPFMLELSLMET